MSWIGVETTTTPVLSPEAQIRIKSLELAIEFCKGTHTTTNRMLELAEIIENHICRLGGSDG